MTPRFQWRQCPPVYPGIRHHAGEQICSADLPQQQTDTVHLRITGYRLDWAGHAVVYPEDTAATLAVGDVCPLCTRERNTFVLIAAADFAIVNVQLTLLHVGAPAVGSGESVRCFLPGNPLGDGCRRVIHL